MTQALTLPAAGLMTDPGPFTAAPDGGMCEAQNVVVLRPGVMEPRPGTQWFKDSTLKSNDDDSSAIYCDPTGNVFAWASTPWIIRENGSTTITGPSSFIAGKIRTAPTGGRALFTSENGVCTLPGQLASPASGSATVAYRAGMPQPWLPVLSASTIGAIPAGSSVAYRVTLRRKLANGTIVESAPSARTVFTDVSAAPFGVFLSGTFTTSPFQAWRTDVYATNPFGDLIAGDELCVYRSPAIVGVPSDVMRLRAVLPFNTTFGGFVDPYNPPAPFRDGLADASWDGPALYTNATQDGPLLANYRPQYARDVTLYKGMTFYAGAQTAQRVSLTNQSLGYRQYGEQTTLETVDFGGPAAVLLGSPTITGISANDMRLLSVGQVIQTAGVSPEAAGAFPARTQIVSLTATTATMSANSLVTNAAISLRSWDWVQIEVDTFTLRMYVTTAGAAVSSTNVTSFIMADGYQAAERAWNGKLDGIGDVDWERWRKVQLRITSADDTVSGPNEAGLWNFERTDADAASFTLKSSKPLAWDRYVDSATGVTSAQSGGIAELQWSKTNEPEHCPLPYRTVIGDASSAIRRIVVANQSLLIFKDDGLYQWFGDTPTSYQIELVDRTLILPAPKDATAGDEPSKWAGRFDDRVYAMTTRGPMAVTDTGGTPVGQPILESLRRRFTYAYGAYDESRRALMVDPQSRRVGFLYDLDGTETNGSVGYVLDVDTGTWTYWVFPRVIADFGTFSSLGSPIFAGGYSYGLVLEDRTMLGDASVTVATLPTSCDQWPTETCTITSAVVVPEGREITISAGSEWTPVVGDLLVQGTNAAVVTYVDSTTIFGVDDPTAAIVAGAATWREGFECRCVWTARDERNVAAEKHWQSVAFAFELAALFSRYSTPTLSYGRLKSYFSGYRNPSAAIEQDIDDTSSIGVAPWPIEAAFKRVTVPSDFARDWAIKVGFSIRQACAWFSTAGVSVLHGTSAPDKAAR